MRRFLHHIAIIALAWAAGDALAQYASVPEENLFQTDQQRYGHLRYFGGRGQGPHPGGDAL